MKNYIDKINYLFEKLYYDEVDYKELNGLLFKISVENQLQIHNDLTEKAIIGLYNLKDRLNLNQYVIEHLEWSYFKNLISDENKINDALLKEIINEYKRTKFIAIESILIDLIKEDKITPLQLEEIKNNLQSNEISKQALIFESKNKANLGIKITAEETKKLLEVKAFEFLKYCLEKKAIEKDALELFLKPKTGETSRKIKNILFEIAQTQKNL